METVSNMALPVNTSLKAGAPQPRKTNGKDVPEKGDRQFVTALARGLDILSCFSNTNAELGSSDLARMTGLPQPTVWRLCHTMIGLGYLVTVKGEKMRPGIPALRFGYAALASLVVPELGRPQMQELADKFRAAAGLAVRDGQDMVFVQRCQSDSLLLMNLQIGSRVPLATSALGWAYLVSLPERARVETFAEIEAADPQRWRSLKGHLQRATEEYKAKGYVLNIGYFHRGYNTASVPILGADGMPRYAINCGSAAATLNAATLQIEVAPRLVKIATQLQNVVRDRHE
jgi:DNA-binding IclR family transcriptional regulator